MPKAGMARSYTSETKHYMVQESNAMIGLSGIHVHDCMKRGNGGPASSASIQGVVICLG
jgi:hypothetical protein